MFQMSLRVVYVYSLSVISTGKAECVTKFGVAFLLITLIILHLNTLIGIQPQLFLTKTAN